MDQRKIPWKAEWKAAGLDPGPLSDEEAALVPRLEAENRAFLEQHPLKPILKSPGRNSPRLSPWLVPLAVAAAALVFLVPFSTTNSTSFERIKGAGDPVLMVYRQGPGQAEKLAA